MKDRRGDFDIVHDNQTLGYGMLDIAEQMGVPADRHDPSPDHLRPAHRHRECPDQRRKHVLRRWFRIPADAEEGRPADVRKILTVSESSRRDIVTDFGVDPARLEVITLGVDDVFVPPTAPRVPSRIVAMASADAPMKGIATLLEAFAEPAPTDVEPCWSPSPARSGGPNAVDRFGIADAVRFVHGISDSAFVELMGSAEVACVPRSTRASACRRRS